VEAVAVNSVDTYLRSGRWPTEVAFPLAVGRDLVGTVAAVDASAGGSQANGFEVEEPRWSRCSAIRCARPSPRRGCAPTWGSSPPIVQPPPWRAHAGALSDPLPHHGHLGGPGPAEACVTNSSSWASANGPDTDSTIVPAAVTSSRPLRAVPLTSPRLVLEPLRAEHADELAPVLDDALLHRFIGGAPLGLEELRARFERQARGRSPDGRDWWLNWVAREGASGRPVGTVQATVGASEPEPVAELAWVIASAHQGRGFAKEAMAVVVAWLRERGVSRLRAHIHPQHDASMAVARSLGLSPTAVVVDGEVRWES
jgi:RimJ/RimL family protein N-acetyltransferase